jgi:hypothetical protein
MPVPCLRRRSTYPYLSCYGYVLLQVIRESVVVCMWWFLVSVCVVVACGPCLQASRENECSNVAIASSPRHGHNAEHVLSLMLWLTLLEYDR